MKKRNAVLAAIPLKFCNSGRINISVSCARGSISMILSLQKKRKRLLEVLQLLSSSLAPGIEEDVLERTDEITSMDFSEEA